MGRYINNKKTFTAIIVVAIIAASALVLQSKNAVQAQATSSTDSIFLNVSGIQGESQAKGHPGEIDILSYSIGATNPAVSLRTGGGGSGIGSGKASFQDLDVTMRVNKASPQLFLACASGKHINNAVLTVERNGKNYIKWDLSNVIVTSFKENANENQPPTDEVTFAFSKITYTYTPLVNTKGVFSQPVSGGWDLLKNSGL